MEARYEIQHHMARTLTLCAIADVSDEGDQEWLDTDAQCVPGPGEDWDDTVKEGYPQEAYQKAGEILIAFEQANGRIDIYAKDWMRDSGRDLARFAHCVAMQSLGHGVGLTDDLPVDLAKVAEPNPWGYFEFHAWDFDLRAFFGLEPVKDWTRCSDECEGYAVFDNTSRGILEIEACDECARFKTPSGASDDDGAAVQFVRDLELEKPWAVRMARMLLGDKLEGLPVDLGVKLGALADIHRCFDGVEWDADTLDATAQILRSAGYEIREPI